MKACYYGLKLDWLKILSYKPIIPTILYIHYLIERKRFLYPKSYRDFIFIDFGDNTFNPPSFGIFSPFGPIQRIGLHLYWEPRFVKNRWNDVRMEVDFYVAKQTYLTHTPASLYDKLLREETCLYMSNLGIFVEPHDLGFAEKIEFLPSVEI